MEIIEISKALLTPLIAIVAVYIAYQQYKLSKFNTKRELYDKNLSVYKAIMDYLGAILVSGNVSSLDTANLLRNTSESYFLFKKDVADYIDELYKKGNKLHMYKIMIDRYRNDNSKNEEYESFCQKDEELFEWFTKQFDETKKLFKKYLALHK